MAFLGCRPSTPISPQIGSCPNSSCDTRSTKNGAEGLYRGMNRQKERYLFQQYFTKILKT